MPTLFALSCAVLLFWLLSLLRALRTVNRGPAVRSDDNRPLPEPAPLLSICVPARNEEKNLDACLRSLRAQDYPSLEIVVINDNSTDGTADILARHASEDPRVVAMQSGDPVEGWFGKPNALRQAVARARGEWFLMTDADCVHEPTSARNALGYALASGVQAISLTPRLICKTFWEKLLIPSIGGMLMTSYSFKRVNDPSDAKVFGAGAYFLVSRKAFDAAGGMESVRNAADEDVVFARALKATGLGYNFVRGDDVYATRMGTTLSEIFRGFAKNTFSTMNQSIKRLMRFTFFILILSLTPPIMAGLSAWMLWRGESDAPSWMLWFGIAQYLVILAIQTTVRVLGRFTPWLSVLAPLGGIMVWLVVMNSFYLGLTGKGVAWKGRVYGAGSRR